MMTAFEVKLAHLLEPLPEQQKWLIDDLWSYQAVGIIGGEPKSYKSFLALSMAVAVSSGCPCLGKYPVAEPGPVLLFAAEDALHMVRQRLEGICAYYHLRLADLALWVITTPIIRLDHEPDKRRLQQTVEQLNPRLLILDPLVRLHNVDENMAAAIAPMLAFLRTLQRNHGCAVALVHHARKGGTAMRAGQALRGTSEIHAWGDSNLYLRRCKESVRLTIEHRAHPSQDGIALALYSGGPSVALVASAEHTHQKNSLPEQLKESSPSERVLEALSMFHKPVRLRPLREVCRIRTESLSRILNDLVKNGTVQRSNDGWTLVKHSTAG